MKIPSFAMTLLAVVLVEELDERLVADQLGIVTQEARHSAVDGTDSPVFGH